MLTSVLHAFGIIFFSGAWLSYDHYRPWLNFHAETLALVGLLFLWCSRLAKNGIRNNVSVPKVTTVIVAIACIPWLQWMLGISFFIGDALIVSLYLMSLATAVALGFFYAEEFSHQKNNDGLSPLFFTIIFVALASASIGFLQWLALQEGFGMYVAQTNVGDRAMGNMGQPNQLATLILMGVAAIAWGYEKKKIGAAGLITGVTYLSMILVLTQSRTGIVSALAMATLLAWKSRQFKYKISPWHTLVWILGFLFFLNSLDYVNELLLNSSGRNMNLTRDSGRIGVWAQVINGISQSPWLGYGWNQTPTAHAAGAIAHPGQVTYNYAHSIILDLIAWNGIPIGLAICLASCYWAMTRYVKLKSQTATYAFIGLTPILIHSLLEFPFAYSYFLISAGFLIGIIEFNHIESKSLSIKSKILIASTVVLTLIGARVIYEYSFVEEDFRIVRFENLRVGKTPEDYVEPKNIVLLSQLGNMLVAARNEATRNMSESDIERLRKTSLRFAFGSLSLRYALALGLNNQPEAATQQMRVLHAMYGDFYYQAAVAHLRHLQATEFPELKKVLTD